MTSRVRRALRAAAARTNELKDTEKATVLDDTIDPRRPNPRAQSRSDCGQHVLVRLSTRRAPGGLVAALVCDRDLAAPRVAPHDGVEIRLPHAPVERVHRVGLRLPRRALSVQVVRLVLIVL